MASASHKPTSDPRGPVIGAIVRRGHRAAGPLPPPGSRRQLSAADWRLLAIAAVAQVVAAAALRVMPLRALRAEASRIGRGARFPVYPDDRVAWAIGATGRRLGALSTCLTRALVAELLLDSTDDSVRFTIGVRRGAGGTLEAHAWIARMDRMLIGASADEYVPVVTWTSPRRREHFRNG
jgi:hypothetical protein